ncbi:MAG: hypothetical protein GY930_21645 [bacterium]|nr:hypothetical protein [bacterium]
MTVLLSAFIFASLSPTPHTAVCPVGLGPSTSVTVAQKKGEQPIVLKVDDRTKIPMGPIIEPRGVLLDPRDLPELIVPHLDAAMGLEGLEASLTALFAKNLGFIVEAKRLPKAYRKFAKTQHDNWNEQVSQITSRLDPTKPEQLVYAAIYHDTGRRIFPDKNEMHVVSVPDINLLPIPVEIAEKYMATQILVDEFGG